MNEQTNGSRQNVVWSVVVVSTWIRVMDKPCANFNLLISYMQNKVNKQGNCRKAPNMLSLHGTRLFLTDFFLSNRHNIMCQLCTLKR